MKFTRITIDPNQMGGTPCIRGLRIPATTILWMAEALRYAAAVLERQLAPPTK